MLLERRWWQARSMWHPARVCNGAPASKLWCDPWHACPHPHRPLQGRPKGAVHVPAFVVIDAPSSPGEWGKVRRHARPGARPTRTPASPVERASSCTPRARTSPVM